MKPFEGVTLTIIDGVAVFTSGIIEGHILHCERLDGVKTMQQAALIVENLARNAWFDVTARNEVTRYMRSVCNKI